MRRKEFDETDEEYFAETVYPGYERLIWAWGSVCVGLIILKIVLAFSNYI